MKRSQAVSLGLVPLIASYFGCSNQPPPTHQQLCVDQANRVADDARCGASGGAYYGGGGMPYYHYYYMPYRSGGYPIGYAAQGGSISAPAATSSFTPRVAPGHIITNPNVVRGGFGSIASGVGA